MTATTLRGRVGLEEHGIHAAHRVHWSPTTSLLYMHALARRDGRLAEGGPLVVDTGVHTGRAAQGQVRRLASPAPRGASGGTGTSRSPRRASRGCATRSSCTSRSRRTSTSSTPSQAPTRRTASPFASSPRAPGTRSSRRRSSSTRPTARLGDHVPAGARPARARGRGRSRDGRHAQRHLRRPPSLSHRGADRRHLLRGRDQEVDLHGHERPAAARRRLPDALLGERRRRRPRGGLLRALRHGQDDAVGRPRPPR